MQCHEGSASSDTISIQILHPYITCSLLAFYHSIHKQKVIYIDLQQAYSGYCKIFGTNDERLSRPPKSSLKPCLRPPYAILLVIEIAWFDTVYLPYEVTTPHDHCKVDFRHSHFPCSYFNLSVCCMAALNLHNSLSYEFEHRCCSPRSDQAPAGEE